MVSRVQVFPIALLLLAAPSFGFDLGFDGLSNSGDKVFVRYSGLFQPKAGISNGVGNGSASVYSESLFGSAPIVRGNTDRFWISGGAQQLSLYPDGSDSYNLLRLQVGGAYERSLENGKSLSLKADFGSASDKPSKSADVNFLNVTGSYSFAGSTHSRWTLLLDYSNNRPILNNVPMPGVVYAYFPSEKFQAAFGFPFASVNWQFATRWTFNTFAVFPWILKSHVSYSLSERAEVFVGADFAQETFYRYGRANQKDQLFYDEKRLIIGARSPLSQVLSGDLEAGYAFDRSIFEAESYSTSPANSAELGSNWFLKLGLSATF